MQIIFEFYEQILTNTMKHMWLIFKLKKNMLALLELSFFLASDTPHGSCSLEGENCLDSIDQVPVNTGVLAGHTLESTFGLVMILSLAKFMEANKLGKDGFDNI
jgi:hypothetical protein